MSSKPCEVLGGVDLGLDFIIVTRYRATIRDEAKHAVVVATFWFSTRNQHNSAEDPKVTNAQRPASSLDTHDDRPLAGHVIAHKIGKPLPPPRDPDRPVGRIGPYAGQSSRHMADPSVTGPDTSQ